MQPVDVIRAYIHARKGVWVDIARPDTAERWNLFWLAYTRAAEWFESHGVQG
jgi:hypothetical protein